MPKIDWKQTLPIEEQQILAEILEKARRYEYAYLNAEDVKVAQVWCGIIELIKELRETREVVQRLTEPFRRIAEIGDVEKRRAIERIISEIVKPTDKETEEATKKLVDSLMKF